MKQAIISISATQKMFRKWFLLLILIFHLGTAQDLPLYRHKYTNKVENRGVMYKGVLNIIEFTFQ